MWCLILYDLLTVYLKKKVALLNLKVKSVFLQTSVSDLNVMHVPKLEAEIEEYCYIFMCVFIPLFILNLALSRVFTRSLAS